MADKLSSKEIDDLIINLIGEEIIPLVGQLKNKVNVSEFKLAENLNITVNQVRNMLYKMHQFNLVTFIRKKDKKKGWYIYYWTLNEVYLREALLNYMRKKLEDFKQKLEKEMIGNYFICPNKCTRLALEPAMEQEFRCQECGELMQSQDNSRTIDNLKNRITELEEEIKIQTPKPVIRKPVVEKPVSKKLVKPVAKVVAKKLVKVISKNKVVKKPAAKKAVPAKKILPNAAANKPVQKVVKKLPAKNPVAKVAQKPVAKVLQMPQSKAAKLLSKKPVIVKKAFGFAKKFLSKKR